MASARRHRGTRGIAMSVVALTAAVASAVGAGPASAQGCPQVSVRTLAPTPGATGWSENVTFDAGGNLWVSRSFDNIVERFDRAGRRTARVHVVAPGSIRPGPDGLLYVASGDTAVNMLPGAPRTGRILRMPTDAQHPRPSVFAAGLGMPNGMTFDDAGRLYVADGRLGVLRVDRDGTIDDEWSRSAPHNLAPSAVVNGTGTNGIVALDGNLYVTLTVSATGRVLRVPIADPSAASVAADVTSPLPGLLDDLAVLDHRTLAVTSTTGTIAIVNVPTGSVCSSAVGQPVTSVAMRPNRPDELVAGTESGAVLRIALRR